MTRPETDWERRKRLAAVFGDTEPSTTSDERDDASSERASAEKRGEDWLKSQVPPHHGQ